MENRARLIFEIIDGIRQSCGDEFLLGIRLSPERFGMQLPEIKQVCEWLVAGGKLDFIDISIWDYTKLPAEEKYQDKSLLTHVTEVDFKNVLLTVAGNIRTGDDVYRVLASGVDFVTIGRSAILHHDFPKQVLADGGFVPTTIPVSPQYLAAEGLSPKFVQYMRRWPDFVTKE